MGLIYEPKGKAREYSPLALNVYTQGCEHGCSYCYNRTLGPWGLVPKVRDLTGLAREAARADRQVFLSFIGDPYCPTEETARNTRRALEVLRTAGCSVAILTKGGMRALRDLDLFTAWPGGRIKVGATLTFDDPNLSMETEPGAATPDHRYLMLDELHAAGVRTFASIEPVLDPQESLECIRATLDCCDHYLIGALNHDSRWPISRATMGDFLLVAANMIVRSGRRVYVKRETQGYLKLGGLTSEQCDQEALTLPDRPRVVFRDELDLMEVHS